MIPVSAKLVTRPPSAEKIVRNINFGTAVGITRTAKEGQAAVVDALQGTFTLRGNWYQQSNRFGIKIKPAKPNDLTGEIRTLADWLPPHETGGTKTPTKSSRIAIPTENVRRNKRMIIPRGQRPGALRGKRTFVLQTSKGPVLYQRKFKGKRSRIVALYNLEPRVRIRKQPTFHPVIQKVVDRRLTKNIEREVAKALATMR